MIGKRLFNEYFDALETRDKALEIIIKNNRPAKGKQSVRFEKPEMEGEKGYYSIVGKGLDGKRIPCEDPEIEDVVAYDEVFKRVQEAWKVNQKECEFLDFFQLPVVQTQTVIALSELRRLVKGGYCDSAFNSFSNTLLVASNIGQDVLDEVAEEVGKNVEVNSVFYGQIVQDVSGFTGANVSALLQKLFEHRAGIVFHRSVSAEWKKECWMRAKANMDGYDDGDDGGGGGDGAGVQAVGVGDEVVGSVGKDRARKVVQAWRKVLASRFFYHVWMNAGKPSDIARKAIRKLLGEGMTAHLLLTALYPIAWVCSPLWFGYSDMVIPQKFGSTNDYRSEIKRIFNKKFTHEDDKLFESSKCNWLHYRGKDQVENLTVRLLHHAFMSVPVGKVEDGK
jgi:hypothetical protein